MRHAILVLKHYPEVKEDNYHAFLGAPIIHQRKVLGVLTLQQQHKRRFSEDEEGVFGNACDAISR